MDTHVSELHVDNMEPGSLEERICFQCPRAEELGCTKTFTSKQYAGDHAKQVHDNVRHPCPRAEEFGCEATFSLKSNARTHAKRVHGRFTYSCPRAEEFDCDKRFTSKHGAEMHAKSAHEKVTYVCPVEACVREFTRQANLEKHVRTSHVEKPTPTRKGIDCPRRDDLQCLKTFASPRSAPDHAKLVHGTVEVACPLAEETLCLKKFASKSRAKRHADRVHVDQSTRKRFSCPRAQEENCADSFASPSSARKHAKKQHGEVEADESFIAAWPSLLPHVPLLDESGKRIPGWDKLPEPSVLDNVFACPHLGCSNTNSGSRKVKKHYVAEHMGARWPCKYVEILGCSRIFSSKAAAVHHSEGHIPKICQYDRCLAHVQGRKMVPGTSSCHYRLHVQRGHFQEGECTPLEVRTNERTNEHHLMGTTGLESTLYSGY